MAEALHSLNPREVGSRLQEARKARGLTQQDAAERMDLARTTVVAIEKGERRVQPDELPRFAELYGRSVNELLRTGEPLPAFSVQLRGTLRSDSVSDQELLISIAEFERMCSDYVELERICDAPLPRRYPPQYQIDGIPPETAAEDVASSERNRLGLGDGPLLNLREVLENDVGLRIFYPRLPSRIAAMFEYNEQAGGCIAVNQRHPPDRGRMSLSHDYAHFLTNRYRPEVTLISQYRRNPEHERFAEAFARAFLMPAAGLSRRYHELRRSRDGTVTPADLCMLAHLFFVSLQALTLRLEDLRLLPSGTWDRLQESGFSVREAQALLGLHRHPVSVEPLPLRYRLLAVTAYRRGDLSEGQLARFLRVDRLEARRIADELSRSLLVSDEGDVRSVELDLGEALAERSA
jgi:Zn-dependent peptidase ImmA (M78 family)/DNA-binding XRE family transcriptional regulator